MPNGHGGAPFLGSPVLFAVVFCIVALLPPGAKASLGWAWVALGLALAALAGWRLAYHLHMRDADEYGGGYTPAEARARATRRYLIVAPVYVLITTGAGLGVLWWRGLP